MKNIAVLFTRKDSVYKSIDGVDVWDVDRDAMLWPGGTQLVAHPPCRAWGRLHRFANPRPGEKDLARFAIAKIRQWGGVLEHPKASKLWVDRGLPKPGQGCDEYGGWSIEICQMWWGHRAEKRTWLYICGCHPRQIPPYPIILGEAAFVVSSSRRKGEDGKRLKAGDFGFRPEITKSEREHTPIKLAKWLVELARQCRGPTRAGITERQ